MQVRSSRTATTYNFIVLETFLEYSNNLQILRGNMETIKGNLGLELVPSKNVLPISLHNQVKNSKILTVLV